MKLPWPWNVVILSQIMIEQKSFLCPNLETVISWNRWLSYEWFVTDLENADKWCRPANWVSDQRNFNESLCKTWLSEECSPLIWRSCWQWKPSPASKTRDTFFFSFVKQYASCAWHNKMQECQMSMFPNTETCETPRHQAQTWLQRLSGRGLICMWLCPTVKLWLPRYEYVVLKRLQSAFFRLCVTLVLAEILRAAECRHYVRVRKTLIQRHH